MNNKAHLRPQDYDSNGDIIPMACKEEKSDLISRKWLTDAIRNRRTYLSYEDAKDVIDLIDNAPAVEYTFEEAFQQTVCEQRLYCSARPKGEWLPDAGGYQCNKCFNHALEINGIEIRSNFCPNCGTDMRGEEE